MCVCHFSVIEQVWYWLRSSCLLVVGRSLLVQLYVQRCLVLCVNRCVISCVLVVYWLCIGCLLVVCLLFIDCLLVFLCVHVFIFGVPYGFIF